MLSPVLGELTSRGARAEAISLLRRRCRALLAPAEMLPAIEGDHLSRHRRRGKDETDRRGDLLRAGAPPQRNRSALPRELFLALARARQRRTRTEAVDADARRAG